MSEPRMPDSNSKRSSSNNPEVPPPTEILEDHALEMEFSINNRNIQELQVSTSTESFEG